MLDREFEINKEIGKKIKSSRLAQGVTQALLAEQVGVSFQQFQKMEIGQNRVSAARLQLICEYLKLSPLVFYIDNAA
jgi:transcriptional regulator with XRE-family HTH domain